MKQTQKHKRLLIAGGVLAVMALCAAAWFGFTAMGNAQLEADSALEKPGSSSESVEKVTVTDDELSQLIKGDITLDSVSVYARQAGARYWFDDRPVQFKDNQLIFDKFAIYTTSKNPFTIDGKLHFRNMERPTANLNLLA